MKRTKFSNFPAEQVCKNLSAREMVAEKYTKRDPKRTLFMLKKRTKKRSLSHYFIIRGS